jgi:hypothetical protein
LPHVAGVPFVIALEAFHGASSLFHAVSPLATYLLGRRDAATFDDDGTLRLSTEQVSEHEYNGKVIPGGLFALPEAAHLAGVVFSNSATVSKFNRMGTELGYGPDDVAMIRIGAAPDPDPNAALPIPFVYLVGGYDPEEREEFSEGWHMIHNPWATLRIDPQALPSFTHHQLQDNGLVLTTGTRLAPLHHRPASLRVRGLAIEPERLWPKPRSRLLRPASEPAEASPGEPLHGAGGPGNTRRGPYQTGIRHHPSAGSTKIAVWGRYRMGRMGYALIQSSGMRALPWRQFSTTESWNQSSRRFT